ncbi:hypothetical protein AOC10_01545 [Polynucleobacter asymbioticus]|uniref:hypothetical protein n=1 Tax=Polynucleobacter asymbioticus TaxID=576611 RepID=UPI0008FB177C|nr:hypothetical protein [Polynucleobacter asymbioticus]APC05302.1 hypothetical protein AOC10_01545 [Polynucleobacter asymbioticus]
MKFFCSLICVASLAGCAQFPNTHPNPAKNNTAAYRADMKDCADAYTETPSGGYLKQRVSCMELKGWE